MSRMVYGIDVGGTFTDFVSYNMDTNEVEAWKNLSTPASPVKGVLTGLERVEDKANIHQIRHGSTIATNAILERKGATIAYITNKGFKDIPFIGRCTREFNFNLKWVKPAPLVKRRYCYEVGGRLNYKGEVLEDLPEADLAAVVAEIKKHPEIEAVAVCLLHCYANPIHEDMVGEYFAKYLPDMPISLSHRVSPQWKEFERSSTTMADAYIRPIVTKYMDSITSEFKKNNISRNIMIMKSNGGLMTLDATKKAPVHTAVSGPTGGVIAAKMMANLCGFKNLVTYDMGGTSTDVAVVKDGVEQFTTAFEISWGMPIQVPMIDIRTIGAGGGSIAWIDKGGMLRVGPESSGADPGPACYKKGGQNATITDANVVLGRINPDYFLGGKMEIDKNASIAAIKKIGDQLGMSVEATASDIVRIANSNMVGALRSVLIEGGNDPRDFSILSFGGAGALHACDIMEICGAKETIIPQHPGQFCAFGFLFSDARVDLHKTIQLSSTQLDTQDLADKFDELKEEGLQTLREQGYAQNIQIIPELAMRYQGQNFELSVPVNLDTLRTDSKDVIFNDFHRLHKERFGFMVEGEAMEIVNMKMTVISVTEKPTLAKIAQAASPAPVKDVRKVVYEEGTMDAQVYERSKLLSGHHFVGPALIEEDTSVTVVMPGQKVRIDDYGNIIISKKEA